MRKKNLSLVVLLTLLVVGIIKSQTASDTIRVMTYNIHAGVGIDGRFDVERIADIILNNNVDIVGLQEVDKNTNRSGNVDIAKQVAEITGMEYVFGPNFKFDDGEFGNAILSKYPIFESWNLALPRIGNNEQRGLLKTKIQIGNKIVSVWNTHLDYKSDNSERILSAKTILDEMRNNSREEIILMGDLNDTPESKVIRLLTVHFSYDTEIGNNTNTFTFPADNPNRKIDYILLRKLIGSSSSKIISSEVIESEASDHLPVISIIKLTGVK